MDLGALGGTVYVSRLGTSLYVVVGVWDGMKHRLRLVNSHVEICQEPHPYILESTQPST